MDTQRLRHFCVVVETGGLREASRLLGISHSGLSKSLKLLEQELAVDLFAPSGRGVVVTDPGRRVYEAARRVLVQADDLVSVARGATPVAPPLRIATFEVFSTYFAGELIARAFPTGRRIQLKEAIPGAIEASLADDSADIGITYLPMPRVEVEYLRAAHLEMSIFGRADVFAKTKVEELPFCAPAIPVSGGASAIRGLDGWPDDALPRSVPFAADMLESALDLARRGLAVVYLPSFVAALHNRATSKAFALQRLPTPKEAAAKRREVFLVKRRSTAETNDMKRIARVLREVCRLEP